MESIDFSPENILSSQQGIAKGNTFVFQLNILSRKYARK
jgi:hypothetical protein